MSVYCTLADVLDKLGGSMKQGDETLPSGRSRNAILTDLITECSTLFDKETRVSDGTYGAITLTNDVPTSTVDVTVKRAIAIWVVYTYQRIKAGFADVAQQAGGGPGIMRHLAKTAEVQEIIDLYAAAFTNSAEGAIGIPRSGIINFPNPNLAPEIIFPGFRTR